MNTFDQVNQTKLMMLVMVLGSFIVGLLALMYVCNDEIALAKCLETHSHNVCYSTLYR